MLTNTIDSLVKESERIYLAREKAFIPGQDYIRRHFLYPALMITRGFDFAKKEFIVYSVMYFMGIFFTLMLLKEIPQGYPPEITRFISSIFLYGMIFLPIFAALFLPPSTYTNSRINPKNVSQLLSLIPEINIDELEKIFQIHYDMAEKRILFMKRLYGVSWAIFIYLFKSLDKAKGIESKPIENDLAILAFYSIALILGFLFIQAYSKSAETIITNVKIALVEKKCL